MTMPDALEYIKTKFDLTLSAKSPIEIPNVGRDPGLARLFYLLEYTMGAEIGVERGLFSEALCRENPLLVRLYCVDAWQAYHGYRDHVDQTKLSRFHDETQARLAPYKAATILRMWSTDAAQQIPDGSLDFVYIDAAHDLPSVIADLKAWTPKVRAGGVVSGHDFLHHKWPAQMHVVQAVHAWTDAYNIGPWFVLGRKAKLDGEHRDDGRSWFWVQPARPVIPRGTKVKR